jgi:hypothetical protein
MKVPWQAATSRNFGDTRWPVKHAVGADAFANRARSELLASGEQVRRRNDLSEELTRPRRQIAWLASRSARAILPGGGASLRPVCPRPMPDSPRAG